MPNQNHLNLVFFIRDFLLINNAGIQNNTVHQYSVKFATISPGKTPKTAATTNPISPDNNLKYGV